MYLLLFIHVVFIALVVIAAIILAVVIVKAILDLFSFLVGFVIGVYLGLGGKHKGRTK